MITTVTRRTARTVTPWVGVAARLVVGGMLLVAGLLKLPDPAANVRVVRAYELLPESLVSTVGHAQPIVEVMVGLLLLVGLLTRVAAGLSALLLVAFIVGIAAAWARGLQIECGCFGGGGAPVANASAKYPWEIARNAGLLLLSGWLIWRPWSAWALDNRVFLRESPESTSR